MRRDRNLKTEIIIVFITILIFGAQFSYSKAEEANKDSFTFATYYPSTAQGTYKTMVSYKAAVGDTNADNRIDMKDIPLERGQLEVERGIVLKPQQHIENPPDEPKGSLVYSASDSNLYTANGQIWQKQVSNSGACFVYKCNKGEAYHLDIECSNVEGEQGHCPEGFTEQGYIGTWGRCDGESWPSRMADEFGVCGNTVMEDPVYTDVYVPLGKQYLCCM
jgi:hypothetical protein